MTLCVLVCVMYVCGLCACVHNPRPLGTFLLNDNRVEVSEAHDDIQRDRGAQMISIQTQVPDKTEQVRNMPLQ